jgi:hypothetical protein
MVEKVPPDAKLAFVVMLILASTAAFLDVGVIGWLVAPICILLGWFAIFRSPLRATMLTLMFFALVLENPSEGPAAGRWKSPFFTVGALLLTHFKTVIGGFWFFGGLDLMLLAAGITWFVRYRGRRSGVGTPAPMIRFAQLVYVTIFFMWLLGKWRGGNPAMAVWQIDRVMYLPAVFLLCQAAFTRPNDYIAVGKVALVAAVLRASQAIWVRLIVPAKLDPITGESSLPYATTHHDSMLFGMAAVLLVALMLQRIPRAGLLAALLGPILAGGMIANGRRMVWIQVIMVFVTVYLITEQNAFKRKVQRWALFLLPIVAVYVIAGWGSSGGIFKPVNVIRSAVDSSTDGSTAWRDLENFDLIYTLRMFPLFGTGYGNSFAEIWPLPAVDYELERFIPHNSLLGLWCYGGYAGYTGLTLLWVGGVFFALRAYHHSKVPLEKAGALVSFGMILIYYIQCFGDLGLGTFTGVFLVGPSLAIGCKLAMKTGAWQPLRAARRVAASIHTEAQP